MTREEAINKAWVYLTSCFPLPIEDVDEIMQAIEQPCKDAVSRASVFEIMGNLMGIPYECDRQITEKDVSESMDEIKNLPSVTPVACIAEFRFSKEDMQEIVDEKIKDIVVERKKGKWIINEDEDNRIWNCHCSECKKDPQDYIFGNENWWLVKSQLPNFCPNCGLEMEGVEVENVE